jgi:hypothetical protein
MPAQDEHDATPLRTSSQHITSGPARQAGHCQGRVTPNRPRRQVEKDTVIAEAVKSLRAHGYSWAEIGSRLGITRQAPQQRWGTSP